MATWGDINMQIRAGRYSPPHADAGFATIRVLPPDTGTDHVEVEQQGGRSRKVIRFEGQCWSMEEYNVLLNAHFAAEVKLFTGPHVVNLPCFIKELSAPEYVTSYSREGAGLGLYRYSIVLCEEEMEEEEEGEEE